MNCSFVVSLLISAILRQEEEIVAYSLNDSLSAGRLYIGELCFTFEICPVMENMHSTSTDDALLVSTTSTMLYQ